MVQSAQRRVGDSYVRRVTLETPLNTPWEPLVVQQCIVGLFSIDEPFSLQIRAKQHEIAWCIDVPQWYESTVTNYFYGLYPSVLVMSGPKVEADIDFYTFHIETAAPFVGPLGHATDFTERDPLAGILTVMSTLREAEECIVSLTLNPPTKNYQHIGSRMVTESRHKWWHFLTPALAMETYMWHSMMGVERRLPKYDPDIQREAERKLRMPLKEGDLVFKLRTTSQQRAHELLQALAPSCAVFGRDGLNYLVTAHKDSYQLVLSAPEVAAFWHLPTETCNVPGISWVTDKHVPPPVELTQVREGLVLGRSYYQGRQIDVRLADEDRITHVNLIGRIRTGKSTLMHNMIHQDIQAGKGVGVIDPHGDLIEDILRYSIPRHRENDVVLFDWNESERIIGLNPLHVPDGIDVDKAATQTLNVFHKFFVDDGIPGRTEDTLYAALVSLMSVKGSVVQDIPRLLQDVEFRQKVVAQLQDHSALDFWQFEYDTANDRLQRELTKPVVTRIRKLYRDKTLRRVVGQPDCLDISSIMSEGKIFLANLRGVATLEGNTIGALLTAKFQMAAMSRSGLPSSERIPFYLYIDEVQKFVDTNFLAETLSEVAKYKMYLVIANQFLGQLEGDAKKAVLGNVGTNIMFRIGRDDADTFSSLIEPIFSRDDLINLSRFRAVVKTQHEGITLPAFLIHTNPPPTSVQKSADVVERITQLSRSKYGRPIHDIDAEQMARYKPSAAEPPRSVKEKPDSPDLSDPSGEDFRG